MTGHPCPFTEAELLALVAIVGVWGNARLRRTGRGDLVEVLTRRRKAA